MVAPLPAWGVKIYAPDGEQTSSALPTTMWAQVLLGILALSPAIAEQLLPNYLVTLPAQLHFPSTQKVCLDLSPGYYDVKFTVTLETKNKAQKLLEHRGMRKRHLHCMSFLVPPPAGGTEEVATVRVSGTGNNISFEEKKTVLIQRQGHGTFVQTDKPIYKPGQRVHFRIVTLDSNFVPVNDKYSMVELQDPNNNRIAQWLEVVPEQGIVQLSFQLAPEATLGTYTVAVAEGKTFGTFSVEEYVLPKFKVEVVEPRQLSTMEESFLVKICCRYTYGKPMLGAVQVSVCQKAHNYWFGEAERKQLPDKCRNLSGQTDKAGCFSASVHMSTFNLTGYMYRHSINIVTTVVEEGTGVEANGTQEIYISSQIGSMTFEDTNNYYYPNFPFSGKIRVRGHDGSLLKNHEVFLMISGINATINHTLVTDNEGLASFKLDTVHWNGTDISLQGRFQKEDSVYNPEQVPRYYQDAYLHLQPFYNTTHSFLRINRLNGTLQCGQPQEVLVEYDINPADANPDQEITFSYYLIGKGRLEMEGQKHMNSKKKGLKGSFSLSLTINSRLAPDASLVVYAIFSSGGVIADKIQFSVEMCFDNKVSLGFSPSQQLPGSDVDLQLQAAPGSLCAIRAVDESVLLLRPERELSNHSVYGMFPFWYGYYPYQVDEYDECPVSGPTDLPQSRRSVMPRYWFSRGMDLFRFFQNMGLKILSNAKVKKPVDCSHHSPEYGRVIGGSSLESDRNTPLAFGSSSSSIPSEDSQVRQYFPETWLWDLLPIGNSGKEAVHLTVPDTITKWKAMTFCTSQSSGFGLSPTVGLTAFKPFFVDLTLPYSVVRGESFRLTATIFNYLKDCITVQTNLANSEEYRVESRTDSHASSCLCADEAKTYHWTITAIRLGHVNFTISTKILDSNELCGGQKGFVPAKGGSDTLIKPVLVKIELWHPHLEIPLHAMLPSLPNRLTAFVTKCFGQAREFIFIDDKNIQDALKWMAGNQLPSGCYANVGKLMHTAMKVQICPGPDPMVSRGLQCLRNSVSSTTNLYTLALLAYTFSLAGAMDIRDVLLEQLEQQAIISGESIHWSQKPTQPSDASPWSKMEAVDVELTAYVLLAWLSKANLTQVKRTCISMDKFYIKSESQLWGLKINLLLGVWDDLEVGNTGFEEIKRLFRLRTVLRYNIFPPKNVETFSLSVEMGKARCDQPTSPRSLTLTIRTSYVGSRSSSNMAIVEVKMLSGFNPMEGTDQLLLQQPLVKKIESGTDTLNIYLEELSKKTQTYTFTISQSVLVTNLKPATIRVYDYYLPDEQAIIQYSDPCE
ncbi:PREDICTED: alpha-2-macroglobulin-like protein 1 [Myotis davidii]|uniref:alpha-2-macroglobulin-like protein 1 n=1 Tax=Myotis davidii TaxID=225400 RepID=UPI000767A7FA|nr:PREDICTED: alpha-2-macroglobulin-like protein 1 [Myotis davidii]